MNNPVPIVVDLLMPAWKKYLPDHNLTPLSFVKMAVNLALIVMVGYAIAQLVSLQMQDPPEPTPAIPKKALNQNIPDKKTQDITKVANMNLFGEVKPKNTKVTNAPETKLNLTLRGIYFDEQGNKSIAIIQDNSNKKEQHYIIGERVFNVAGLEQIHIDRVILLHNNRHETLRLPKKSLNLKVQPDAEVIASKTIQEFRNDLLTGNIEKYVFHIDYETVYEESEMIGFRIIGDSDEGKEILSKIGLADGDIVTEIDGAVIATNQDALKIIKDLREAKKATIGIKRGGTTQYLNLDFTK